MKDMVKGLPLKPWSGPLGEEYQEMLHETVNLIDVGATEAL